MEDAPSQVVSDIGSRLALSLSRYSLPKTDCLRKSLRQAANALSELDQSPSLKSIISPLSGSLVKRSLLQHKDEEVRLYVTICLTEIVRVLAPEPPFNDNALRDIFKLILCVFAELADTKNAYFLRRVKVVETVAELKFCFQMLDIGCDDLILEMFNIFFSVARNGHPLSLVDSVLSIMTLILKEEVTWPLLYVIFRNLLKEGKGAPAASYDIAVRVIKNCNKELEPYVCVFLASCISDKDAVVSELKEFYHEIIFEIFQCSPRMLGSVIPSLTEELLTDQVDVRIKAVNLVGKLFELSGCHVPEEFGHLFEEFLKRFSDKSAEVRLNALQCGKTCYLCNPRGPESAKVLNAIEGRLLDCDDRVRTHAVVIACDLACSTMKYVSAGQISRIAERLRDKKISVRKNALRKLLELYREYCIKCFEAHGTIIDQFEQIPCNILMLCYDKDSKDFGPQNLETVLGEDLFPASLSAVEETTHWIYLFSLFKPAHVKALSCILSQKQRLQTELRGYLAFRKKQKYVLQEVGSEEVQDRIKRSFAKMSISFPDPAKAEECFHRLDKVKDNNFFHMLGQLLDEVTTTNAQNIRDKLTNIIGEKHSEFDFLCTLYTKCSHNLFSSDHVGCILDDISSKSSVKELLELPPSVSLFATVVGNFPSLLRGCEAQFQDLLLKEYIFQGIKDNLIQVLAKVGSHVSLELSVIYPCLERVCLEGDRTQSKYAVSALAAVGSSSESSIFSQLFEKLMNFLHAGKNIPTVLQSLGCIAQYSAVTFQMQDQAIRQYIKEKIFKSHQSDDTVSFCSGSGCCCSSGEQSDDVASFCEISGSCMLKICALKMLVKSFLPHQRAQVEHQISDLLDILSNMLEKGEVFSNIVSSENDRAHIKLVAAKSVLRLSKRWDFHINPQVFHSTIMMAKYSSSVGEPFIVKVHNLLRDHAMPSRYACAFALATSDSLESLQDKSLEYMAEFICERSKEAQMHQAYVKQGGSITNHPAYIVVYLIHILAHDIEFPSKNCLDLGIFVRFCRPLFFTLAALVNTKIVDGDVQLAKESVSNLLNIFRAINKAEDALDAHCTPKLHVLSEIGISILNKLNDYDILTSPTPGKILLPSSLYKRSLAKTSEEATLGCLSSYSLEKSFIQKVVDVFKPLAPKPGDPLAKWGQLWQEDTSQLDVTKSGSNLTLSKEINSLTNAKKTKGKRACNHGITKFKTVSRQRRRQKQVCSTSACSTGLHIDCSKFDGHRNVTSGNSQPVLEKELVRSCDSVTETSVSESQVLAQKSDILSSCPPKESDGAIRSNYNTEEHSECSWAELKDNCNLKDIFQNSGANIGQGVSFSSYEKRVPGEYCSITNQQLIVDIAQLKETLPNKEKGCRIEKRLPASARRKKAQGASAHTSSSEVVNVNDDVIARRTRRRKV